MLNNLKLKTTIGLPLSAKKKMPKKSFLLPFLMLKQLHPRSTICAVISCLFWFLLFLLTNEKSWRRHVSCCKTACLFTFSGPSSVIIAPSEPVQGSNQSDLAAVYFCCIIDNHTFSSCDIQHFSLKHMLNICLKYQNINMTTILVDSIFSTQ